LLTDLDAIETENYEFRFNYIAYTKDSPKKEVKLRDVKSLNDRMETKLVIHGYLTRSLDRGIEIKDITFKSQYDVGRVVIVDWRQTSWIPHYEHVAEKIVPGIAEDLTKVLIYFRNKGYKKFELVGHSLGAHIAGQSGRSFKLKTGKEIDSIIGKVVSIYKSEL